MPGRSFFFLRHAERCDFTVEASHVFVEKAFDTNGNYTRFDLNLPESLPKRSDGHEAYQRDTPLTVMGYLQATLIGKEYRRNGVKIDQVYSSPALRSIETAQAFLEGYGLDTQILIESALFQWTRWFPSGLPSWISPKELASSGYKVDPNYSPCTEISDLTIQEPLENYYTRSSNLVRTISEQSSGNILFVGHSGTLEACTRTLCGKEARSEEEYYNLLGHCTYLASLEMRQTESGTFHLAGCPVMPLTVSRVQPFDADMLTVSAEDLAAAKRKTKHF